MELGERPTAADMRRRLRVMFGRELPVARAKRTFSDGVLIEVLLMPHATRRFLPWPCASNCRRRRSRLALYTTRPTQQTRLSNSRRKKLLRGLLAVAIVAAGAATVKPSALARPLASFLRRPTRLLDSRQELRSAARRSHNWPRSNNSNARRRRRRERDNAPASSRSSREWHATRRPLANRTASGSGSPESLVGSCARSATRRRT